MDGMLAEMTAADLETWQDYNRLEPFGSERDNMHAGLIAATIANVNRASGSEPAKIEDFMLRVPEPTTEKAQGQAELLKAKLEIALVLAGKLVPEGKLWQA